MDKNISIDPITDGFCSNEWSYTVDIRCSEYLSFLRSISNVLVCLDTEIHLKCPRKLEFRRRKRTIIAPLVKNSYSSYELSNSNNSFLSNCFFTLNRIHKLVGCLGAEIFSIPLASQNSNYGKLIPCPVSHSSIWIISKFMRIQWSILQTYVHFGAHP